jgi:hypothetical protein
LHCQESIVTLRQAFPEQPLALVLAMAGDKQHRWGHAKGWTALSILQGVLAECWVVLVLAMAGDKQHRWAHAKDWKV